MSTLKTIIKIAKGDYDVLVEQGSITKGGVVYTYDPDETLYMVDDGLSDDYVVLGGGSGVLLSKFGMKTEINDLSSRITNETTARKDKDTALSNEINILSTTVDTKVDKVSGKGLSTNDYTTEEKSKLAGIAPKAEVNQNAFSNVTVGSTTITADSKTDTITLVAGSNVTLTPDATNDKITISSTDTDTHYTSKNVVTGSEYSTANAAATNGNVRINHIETTPSGNSSVTSSNKIEGIGGTDVSSDASGNITIKNHDVSYATSPSDTRGHWTVTIPGITELYDGLKINVRLSTQWYVNGESYNTLNVNGLGPQLVWYRPNERLTSHFSPKYSECTLTYWSSNCGSYTVTTTTGELVKGNTYTGGWMCEYAYYSTDVSNLNIGLSRPTAASALGTHHLCALDKSGMVVSLVSPVGSYSSSNPFTPTATAFRPEYIYIITGSFNSGATIDGSYFFTSRAYAYLNYNFNSYPTTAISTIYLVGTLDNATGLFTLDQTTTGYYLYVPCNAAISDLNTYFTAGKYYICIGKSCTTSSSYFSKWQNNTVYYFDGSNLVPVIALADRAKTADTATALNTGTVGALDHPVYFSEGQPVACTDIATTTDINNAITTVDNTFYKQRGLYSTTSNASSIPAKTELTDISKAIGSYSVIYPGATGHLLHFKAENNNGSARCIQMYTGYNLGMYWRQSTDANLEKDWRLFLDTTNYTSYVPTKTGSGASGTWGINISGTAAKATADKNGSDISTTYATKTELTNGLSGKANTSHTHTKSEITDFPTSMKNPSALTIKLNGTSQGAYDGSSAKEINITAGSIGAVSISNNEDKSITFANDEDGKLLYVSGEYDTVRIGNVDDPVNDQDVATKSYVDTSIDTSINNLDATKDGTSGQGINVQVSQIDGKISGVSVSQSYNFVLTSEKGAKSGVATLDTNGKVPSSQLPSYVDDVLEYSSKSGFPSIGETGKIYVATDTNLTYRWSGSAYVEISPSLALGETSSTAYYGDKGKTAYDHSQLTSGNPHKVTKSDVGLGNVDNTADANKSVKYATSAGSASTAGSATTATKDIAGNQINTTYLPKLRVENPSTNTSSTEVGITPFNVLGYKSSGYPVYTDPEFASGVNDVYVYNNISGSTDVTITRGTYSDFGIVNPGNASGYVLRVQHTGTNATPGYGGFYFPIVARKNAVFVQIFRAKIPVGYKINRVSNPMGDSYGDTFITDNTGTGKWEWYGRIVHCGSTGSFAAGGHIYLSATTGAAPTSSAPINWYISYANIIDITKGGYDGLRTRYSDNATYATSAGSAISASTVAIDTSAYSAVADSCMPATADTFAVYRAGASSGAPGSDGNIIAMTWANTQGKYGSQIYVDCDHTGNMAFRQRSSTGVWTDWYKLIHSGNISSQSVASAGKLTTARSINGTSFNGTADITTSNWGTARNIYISDSDGSNTGSAVSVNGSAAVTLKLPSTIKATLKGNADTATSATTADSADSVAWSNVTGKPNSGTYIASTTKNGYEGMMTAAGSDSGWIRTTESGLIPYSSNTTSGSSFLGTSSWPFKGVYAKTFYGNLTGNASTATKLQTPRTISLGTAVTSTPTTFSGESNITIPVNTIKETYLAWGGKNINAALSPIGMAISAEHSANRLAFINGDALTFEYSSDGGSTWTDYNYPAATKSAWCTTVSAVPVGRSDASTDITLDMRTRVTLAAQDGTTYYVYTNPRKLLVRVSNACDMKVLIEYKTGVSGASWVTYGEYPVSGLSGWNEIPLILSTLGGGYTQTGNIWYLRLTFIVTSLTTSSTYAKQGTILGIRLFGTNDWVSASILNGKGNMSSTGHLYSYDINANATFPAAITAKGSGIFYYAIYEGGTSSSHLLSNKYAAKSHTHDDRYYTETEMDTKLSGKVDNTAAGVSTALNTLTTGEATPSDTDYYISQYANGGTTTTTYHRRPLSALWTWIKSKLATVAISGSYLDLKSKPVIPTVGNGKIQIYQNDALKGAFSMNQSDELTINLTDTKVTGVSNHYTPSQSTTKSASGGTLTDITNSSAGVNVVTGVEMDAAGHVTGVTSKALKSVNTNTTYSTGTASVSGLTKLYTSTGTNTDGTMTQSAITTALSGKAASSHTHSYAGSSSAGGAANSANKLNTDAGSTTTPVYFSNGVPVALSYSINKNVPSDAVFTDTHYTSKNVVTGSEYSTANAAATNGNARLNHVENGSVTSSHIIKGTGATTVTSDSDGTITINSTDTNTTYSAGTGISLSGTTFSNSGVRSVSQGSNGFVNVNTNGTSSSIAVYSLPTATASQLGGVVSQTTGTTTGRDYNVEVTSGGKMKVNVPWTDTNTTYSAAANSGISLSGTAFSNSGVRSVSTGSANGTISVNTNGTSTNVSVKGLGSAAYTESSAYAAASHSHSYNDLIDKPSSLKNPYTLAIGTADTPIISYNGSELKGLTIKGGGLTTVTGDATTGSITISSTGGTSYSAGTGISISNATISNTGVTGIKGAADSVYKTGNVNLTPANIGAASSSHSHSNASTSTAGFMSARDKTNLDNLTSFIAYDDINVAVDGEVATDVCDEIRDMVYAGIGCAVVVMSNSSMSTGQYSAKYLASISIPAWTDDTDYSLNVTIYFEQYCIFRNIRRTDEGAYVVNRVYNNFGNTNNLTKGGTTNMANGGVWSAINTPATTASATAVTTILTSTSSHRILHTATTSIAQTYTLPASPVANETFVFYKLFTPSTLTIKSTSTNMYNIKTGSTTNVSSISYTASSSPSRCKITCIYNNSSWYIIPENLND